MIFRSWDPHVSTVDSEPERIVQNLGTATAGSKLINEADFAAQLTWARHVDDLFWDNLDLLPKQAVDENVDDEPEYKVIDEKVGIFENQSTVESGYAGPTHNDIHRTIREAFVEHKEERLRRLTDDRCEKAVLWFLREAQKCAVDNVHAATYNVRE